jgi:hypothetical protein
MFTHSYDASLLPCAALVVALQIAAIVVLWRGALRTGGWKLVWTVAIVLLPLVGAVGFFANEGVGAATRRLPQRER